MSVKFENVSKRFTDGTLALDNLEVERGGTRIRLWLPRPQDAEGPTA